MPTARFSILRHENAYYVNVVRFRYGGKENQRCYSASAESPMRHEAVFWRMGCLFNVETATQPVARLFVSSVTKSVCFVMSLYLYYTIDSVGLIGVSHSNFGT